MKITFKEHGLEREPLRYCSGDGKVTFTRPFQIFGEVTFGEHLMSWKGIIDVISHTHLPNLNGYLSKIKGP